LKSGRKKLLRPFWGFHRPIVSG